MTDVHFFTWNWDHFIGFCAGIATMFVFLYIAKRKNKK